MSCMEWLQGTGKLVAAGKIAATWELLTKTKWRHFSGSLSRELYWMQVGTTTCGALYGRQMGTNRGRDLLQDVVTFSRHLNCVALGAIRHKWHHQGTWGNQREFVGTSDKYREKNLPNFYHFRIFLTSGNHGPGSPMVVSLISSLCADLTRPGPWVTQNLRYPENISSTIHLG